ncbi:MAG: hypothetical protein V2J07_10100 [Anaerolineae bacterium]|jgi:hypothetical protein|nr:hypothetical protein [Anaerolineae bacterium]
MRAFIEFLENYEIWLYGLIGVVALLHGQKLLNALDDLRQASFKLERDTAMRRLKTAVMTMIGLLGIAGIIFITITFISPMIPWDGNLPTPTVDLMAIPTATLEPTPTTDPFTADVTPTPIGGGNGCVEGIIEWTYPLDGDEIRGTITAQGTVNFDALGFYKFEYAFWNSDDWVTISAGNQIVIADDLGGAWNTETVPSGDYKLRIVATDNENNYLTPCMINIRINN